MAREIIERTWCDPCLAEEDGTRTEAKEITVAFGAAKPRIFAVCERHEKELVAPLEQALAAYGVIAERAKAKPGKGEGGTGTAAFTCQYPGCVGKTSISEGGFSQHLYQYHNIGIVAYRDLIAGRKTLKQLGLKRYVPPVIPDVLDCPGDDCARDFTGDTRKGALAGHIARQHPELWEKMGKKLVL